MKIDFKNYIEDLKVVIDSLNFPEIDKFIDMVVDAYKNGKFVFVIGNGGSAANASHFAQDLAKGTRLKIDQPKRLKAISLTDNVPFITAQGNDDGYDTIFEQQLRVIASKGDYLLAISGSGNSPNIIKAVEWANQNGMVTVGLTGFDGGKLKKMAFHSINVILHDMCTAESVHSVILHYIVLELRERFKELD
jgi:D-sedoheptulose 7-phosphate isomerase